MVVFESGEVEQREATANAELRSARTWLKRSQELANIVGAEASGVKAFLGRWKMIRGRLLQLPALLTELSQTPCFMQNALILELLESIVQSLEEAKQLVEKCTELSYIGKLQMQSSLDALAAKLDLHIHDGQLMLKSGVLKEAPVPPNLVTPETSKEAMRWNIRDLLARLQISNTESKQKALDTLVDLMYEDDKNVLFVASQGGIPALVHLLDVSLPSLREKAAAVICSLALNDSCEHLVVSDGAIAPLVRLLESGSSLAKEKAAAALQGLAYTAENARAVAAHGGIPALIELCRIGTPGAQAVAAGAIRNLAGVLELRASIAEEGAIPIIISLVTSGTALAQEHAVAALQNFSLNDDKMRQAISREGGIQPLLRYLDSAANPRAREITMEALRNIAALPANSDLLIEAGFLPRLINVLRNGPLTAQQSAAEAICHLASTNETRRALGEAGIIPFLVKMLEAKTSTAQEFAAQALASLLQIESNCREFMHERQGIAGLVQLLDSRNTTVAKQFSIAALCALASSAKCRKQMVTAGACLRLRALAEGEVSGARRLLERLERGKLLRIFSRKAASKKLEATIGYQRCQAPDHNVIGCMPSVRINTATSRELNVDFEHLNIATSFVNEY
ncbi:hypothetical protein R1flu_001544 [Riccia fluitans]|uniref:DUF7032 domain-containing protein n=1 Tax=Riccia fluitans TaxID=41844 RepID=A0ABD1Y4K5_9MARC